MRGLRGFSLVEVLVACGILVTGVLALAVLLARAVPVNIAAGQTSRAAILAAQKLEELRATRASFAAEGVEYIDRTGAVMVAGGSTPRGAAYVRRWTTALLPGSTLETVVVTVTVEPIPSARAARATASGVRTVP